MKLNPDIHRRRSIRLKGYDYSQSGAYFITICTENRKTFFGEIVDGEMKLNPFGEIVKNQWEKLPRRFSGIELDEFIVMPNHIHGVLIFGMTKTKTIQTVGAIIGAYKSLAVHQCLEYVKNNNPEMALGKIWQRNFYEHIIRNEQSLEKICEYIFNNPMNWQQDEMNLSVGAPLAGALNSVAPVTYDNGVPFENRATARVAPTRMGHEK